MTAYNLAFTVSAVDSSCHLFSVRQPITSSLAGNINFVTFANGAGQIFYNDRQPLPELFTDPSPYQDYIDQWITAAAGATLALTLAQAQAIKCALISAIFAAKRQRPVTVTVSATPYQWDASDQALARMAALAGHLYIDPLNALISLFNALQNNLVVYASGVQTAFDNFVSSLNTAEASVTGWANATSPTAPGTPNVAPDGAASATIQLVPVGGTAAVSMTATDLKNILAAIATQNANEAVANASKQAAVNALSTVAAVAAYDATTGW